MDEVPAEPGRSGPGVGRDTRPGPRGARADAADGALAGGPADGPADDGPVRLTARVEGHVQGVGFRAFVRARANRLGLAGSATNRPDGSVEVVAEGPSERCRALVGVLRDGWTPGWVTAVRLEWGPPRGDQNGFSRQ